MRWGRTRATERRSRRTAEPASTGAAIRERRPASTRAIIAVRRWATGPPVRCRDGLEATRAFRADEGAPRTQETESLTRIRSICVATTAASRRCRSRQRCTRNVISLIYVPGVPPRRSNLTMWTSARRVGERRPLTIWAPGSPHAGLISPDGALCTWHSSERRTGLPLIHDHG